MILDEEVEDREAKRCLKREKGQHGICNGNGKVVAAARGKGSREGTDDGREHGYEPSS